MSVRVRSFSLVIISTLAACAAGDAEPPSGSVEEESLGQVQQEARVIAPRFQRVTWNAPSGVEAPLLADSHAWIGSRVQVSANVAEVIHITGRLRTFLKADKSYPLVTTCVRDTSVPGTSPTPVSTAERLKSEDFEARFQLADMYPVPKSAIYEVGLCGQAQGQVAVVSAQVSAAVHKL